MTKYQLTSNQYYGGLNRRFDRRERLLIVRLGFIRTGNVYHKPHHADWLRERNIARGIQSSALSHADNRAFFDLVALACR